MPNYWKFQNVISRGNSNFHKLLAVLSVSLACDAEATQSGKVVNLCRSPVI